MEAMINTLLVVTMLTPGILQDDATPKPGFSSEVTMHTAAVERQHVMHLNGEPLHYESQAGTLPIFNEADGTVQAEVFHVAYFKLKEQDDGSFAHVDPTTRPLLFLFNGGPGSSSVWLHLGAFGPERVVMGDAGSLLPPPWSMAPNNATLLDVADLVFVDPVTTGYSRAVDGETDKRFHGLEQDADSIASFIRLFITRHERWQSPKFIGGESYGTTRSAAVAEKLQSEHGIWLNGVVLVSSVLDFATIRGGRSSDVPYALFLPTLAATAFYHGALDENEFQTLDAVVEAAEEFALGDYLHALAMGSSLSADERAATVQQLARMTGLSDAYIELTNLRIGSTSFRKELLRDKRLTVGRLDSRFTGVDANAAGARPEYDPSYTAIQGPYTAALNHYIRSTLGYVSDLPYEILTRRVHPWDYSGFEGRPVNVTDRLRGAMLKNPALRVFIASGYFDLATPYFAADYVVDHLGLDSVFLSHVQTNYYAAGHMMYLNDSIRIQLSSDVRHWLRAAVER